MVIIFVKKIYNVTILLFYEFHNQEMVTLCFVILQLRFCEIVHLAEVNKYRIEKLMMLKL